ncbi:MAG: bifunctional diaminohydroxyphosphoribosylaminopyrimidine deaminase/5-amino-6-(5-phosphoribosylamino)uracil reductase RibD [Nitrospirae bacterium]|nr:bifunctional diaminohydroxyphosphoribosylaminopyrimidine deaminase/5-amino-6-(5-phosphoribosylamino)uracil reductase RibD [Nitrospirota bacterium]
MEEIALMRRCLTLARRAVGRTSPNPMVGALLYKDGRIIAEDYHRKAGSLHAEALVLNKAGAAAQGATLFVSLEPCCHTGKRTPPCVDAIVRAKVKRVVAAMADPNPAVSGKGLEMLKNSGIETEVGILHADAKRLNEAYVKFITTRGIPFVTLKAAITLDGKMATPDGQSKWITCEKSRHYVHRLRGSVDAVLTAIGTVKADNPRLTARIRGLKSPVRVVVDPYLQTPRDYEILKTPPQTIICTQEADTRGFPPGVEFIHYGCRLDLKWLMRELGQRQQITSVLIEGGASLTGHAIEDGIVDKVVFFIAPKIIGGKGVYSPVSSRSFRGIDSPYEVFDMKARTLGTDIVIEGYL